MLPVRSSATNSEPSVPTAIPVGRPIRVTPSASWNPPMNSVHWAAGLFQLTGVAGVSADANGTNATRGGPMYAPFVWCHEPCRVTNAPPKYEAGNA